MNEIKSVLNPVTGAKEYAPEQVYGQFHMQPPTPYVKEEKQVETAKLSRVVEDNGSFLSADNFEHWYRISNMMASSDMVPKNYKGKPQDVLLAMEMGRKWGISPLQAIQNIAVINGKPCAYGDLVLAICSAHPDFENIEETPVLAKDGSVAGYTCSVKRKKRSPVVQTFTIEQAKEAGLWGKPGPWKTSSARMLQMRARAFCLRDSFADALMGVSVAEEVMDYSSEVKPKSNPVLEMLKPTMVTTAQLEIIAGLIESTGISNDRISKARTHFNVSEFKELTEGQANEFISMLNREASK